MAFSPMAVSLRACGLPAVHMTFLCASADRFAPPLPWAVQGFLTDPSTVTVSWDAFTAGADASGSLSSMLQYEVRASSARPLTTLDGLAADRSWPSENRLGAS